MQVSSYMHCALVTSPMRQCICTSSLTCYRAVHWLPSWRISQTRMQYMARQVNRLLGCHGPPKDRVMPQPLANSSMLPMMVHIYACSDMCTYTCVHVSPLTERREGPARP